MPEKQQVTSRVVTEKSLLELQNAGKPVQEYLKKYWNDTHTQAIVTMEGIKIVQDVEGVPFSFKESKGE